MTSYLVRRVAWAGLLFLVMSFIAYLIFFVIPTVVVHDRARPGFETIDLRTVIPLEGSLLPGVRPVGGPGAAGRLGYSYVTRAATSARSSCRRRR